MWMVRVNFDLDDDFIRLFDEIARKLGYRKRSEAIKELMRQFVRQNMQLLKEAEIIPST